MHTLFKMKYLALLVAVSFSASAEIIFAGDTKQTNINGSLTSFKGNIVVGSADPSGTPEAPAGELRVNEGSQATGDSSLYIGNSSGATGLVTLTGAGTSLTMAKNILVSVMAGSYGRLNVLDGAALTSEFYGSGAGSVGYMRDSTGEVNISGQGSVWNSNGALNVGENGNGTLTIDKGGVVNAKQVSVGLYAGSQGLVNVDNGTLISSGYTVIGNNGTGVMNVLNGSQVTNSFTVLGNVNGRGELNVSGPGTVYNSLDHVHVGSNSQGSGILTVSDGATLNTSLSGTSTIGESLEVGRLAKNTTGKVLITGNNSKLDTNGGRTIIGNMGSGSLTLQEKGELMTEDITLAASVGSVGKLNIGAAAGEAAASAGLLNPSADINFGEGEATLNFNHINSDYIFGNTIQGTGNVDVNNGETVLTAQNTWIGATNVNNGILKAGAENTFSRNATYRIAEGGMLDLNGYSQTIGSVTNSGIISLSRENPGTVLTINGDYVGDGGLLSLGARLGDDSALTDRVVISGSTSGSSEVAVTNLGGSGAATLNGIEIISVAGDSKGDFTQQGRIVAGAWEYTLARGMGQNNANWYLSSTAEVVPPEGGEEPGPKPAPEPVPNPDPEPTPEPVPNPEPEPTPEPEPGNNGGEPGTDTSAGGDSGKGIHILRPEGGAYAANAYAADNMFITTLSDRLGETEYTDMMTGERKWTSLWMKHSGGHTRFSDSTGQLKTKSNRYVLMLGGDLATAYSDDGAAFRFGALAGYGYNHSNTRSGLSGYHAKGVVNGYTTGVYGTWYGAGNSERGAYADGVFQHSWFNNSVNGQQLAEEKYSAKGFSASLETGYVFPMSEGTQSVSWFVQPKAKVLWSGIKTNDFRETNGTVVKTKGEDNLTTSLGLKTFLKGHHAIDNHKERNFKPFAEVNWIHNVNNRGVDMDGINVSQSGTRNMGELKVGVEGRIAPDLNITGYVNQQIGGYGYSDTSASLGIKYSF